MHNTGNTFTNLVVCVLFWIGTVLVLLTVQGTFNDRATATPIVAEPPGQNSLIKAGIKAEPEIPAPPVTTIIVPEKSPDRPEITGRINQGESFDLAMKRCNVPGPVRSDIIRGFGKALDFRTLQPGDRFRISLDQDDGLEQAIFESGLLKKYVLKPDDNGLLECARQDISLEYRLEKIAGIIDSSLYAAFLELGEEPKLIHAYADIFASKIDFNTEPRQGDRFELLVEKYYKNETLVGYGKILTARYRTGDAEIQGFHYASDKTPGGYFDQNGEALGTWFIRSPIPFGRVTSGFTMKRKHPVFGDVRPHLGVDLAAPTGTPVMATAAGKIEYIGRKGGFGKTVILRHNGGYKTYYGHLQGYGRGLQQGSNVRQKEIIGYVGSTGVATGPHLDYRIQYNGAFKNPFGIKFKAKTVLQDEELASFLRASNEIARLFDVGTTEKVVQAKSITLSDDRGISLL